MSRVIGATVRVLMVVVTVVMIGFCIMMPTVFNNNYVAKDNFSTVTYSMTAK